ncbi:SDR family NAD(P)-dependent oxidoreductase [Actinoplanes sp. DH11]|uniref:SDR family NAD(P)-dependent oxidoreductase n=1 Tax=Actinoplanes sp. DH11 TaxID=2857011 RepID=UPI001E622EDF|nr:SDR family NAD(P)-dependent oxidoreductase [Actinoplanes sp. DH11]
MTITLITGANKGLGFEAARQLIAAGHTVYAAARDAGRGQAAADRLGARFVPLDVTDDDSVKAAAEFVRADSGRLDVLVNNAGIAGTGKVGERIGEITGAELATTLDTNVAGPVRVTNAFLPLLRLSDAPVVVNVSSGLGSMAVCADPSRIESHVTNVDYNASKTALVMVTAQYAKAFPGIRFNAVDPGYTATDLNGNSGPQTVEEGAEILVRMAMIGGDGPTGGFFDRHGTVAW